MRAYYFDNLPGDQRLDHDSGTPVDLEYLRRLGLFLLTIPLDTVWEPEIDQIAKQQGYKFRDIMDITKHGLGDHFESSLKMYFTEHMHDEKEIRYILSGSGFWDIREYQTEEWIRIEVVPGDFLIIPPGIYHRFTLGQSNEIKALRLTKEIPNYNSHARGLETDGSSARGQYLDSLKEILVV
ncbi:1,2-dihydroxy-3-keto-5-methylthiopentene dioxygenase [Multifurca ochricompacta]|uniref:Acireductone dioxygenase n=1 Tax=Multifurca ochricompacta TaxID=376703 RepID=A0AAD4LY49_9AGAM|nr:1,2-dihydroxy-3-keto-5-methylthiopentene dioxygenase [Multifurca ochricompacta]